MKPLPPDIARSLIYAPLPKYPVLASHRAHFGSGTQEPSSRMTGVTNALCRLHDAAGKVIAHRYPPKHRTQMFDDAASPTNDHESALLLSLASANYTAIVRGVNGTTGVALAEAYQVQ